MNQVQPIGRGEANKGTDDKPRSSDEILEHYLRSTSYYKQTLISLSTAIHSVWRKQVIANGAAETKDRLKSFWTSISLVSALLLGVTYGSAVNPVTSADPALAQAVSVAATFSGLSLILSLSVIVVSVIYIIEVDNATTERDLEDFIMANASVVDILTGVFSASVVCLMVSALATMYVTYGFTEFMIVICIAGAITLVGAVFAAIVAGHNRFRLWIRFDSPLGKAHMEQERYHEYKELKSLKTELEFQIRELRELKDLLELKQLKDKIECHAP